jgi:superfamily I DNA and/or RNA helicase
MVSSNKIASFQGQDEDFNLYPELGYPLQESLGFAESPNRLNVALSRAKRLLIVVGNSEHFCKKIHLQKCI